MTTDLDDGADLTATMERALRDARPATDPGPAAMAAGRRMRTRRRAGVVATSAAAVTAVAALAVPLVSGSSPATDDRSGGTDGAGVAAAAPTSAPAADGSEAVDPQNPFPGVESPSGWWDMPADQMRAALEERLPEGVRIVDADPSNPLSGSGSVDVLVEGPSGTGRLSLMLRPRQLTKDQIPDPVTWTDSAGNEAMAVMAEGIPYERNIRCNESDLACEFIKDGAGKRIGVASTEEDDGTTYHNIDLLGPDGGAINFYVADSSGEKPGYEPPTATAPPLTLAEARALVEDPVWTSFRP